MIIYSMIVYYSVVHDFVVFESYKKSNLQLAGQASDLYNTPLVLALAHDLGHAMGQDHHSLSSLLVEDDSTRGLDNLLDLGELHIVR